MWELLMRREVKTQGKMSQWKCRAVRGNCTHLKVKSVMDFSRWISQLSCWETVGGRTWLRFPQTLIKCLVSVGLCQVMEVQAERDSVLERSSV